MGFHRLSGGLRQRTSVATTGARSIQPTAAGGSVDASGEVRFCCFDAHNVFLLHYRVFEHEKRKGFMLFGKGKDKDRKKLIETILKQLKTMTQ